VKPVRFYIYKNQSIKEIGWGFQVLTFGFTGCSGFLKALFEVFIDDFGIGHIQFGGVFYRIIITQRTQIGFRPCHHHGVIEPELCNRVRDECCNPEKIRLFGDFSIASLW
tara:strand:+ start:27332 stop:27661 length:330 start_codon:yes stop_codon:yes gene_type:complete